MRWIKKILIWLYGSSKYMAKRKLIRELYNKEKE